MTIDGASYGLDNAGNRTSKSDLYAGVTTNYGYDNIYELVSATQGANTTESYTYDLVGNRLSNLSGSGWSNNTSNELTARPGVTYTYDANGNTQTMVNSSGTTTYSWDYENRLVSAALPGSGGTVTFKYDPFGRRIYKSSSSGTSVYAYDDDGNLIEETNAAGTAVARYTQGLNTDEPLAQLRSSTTSYYEQDGISSVTSLSNTAGSLAQTYTFDSFGNVTASSGSLTNPFQFTAREFDSETALDYMRARYFDPKTGRFVSEDPIDFQGGINFYAYVSNRPIAFSDPTGLSPLSSCLGACLKIYYGLTRDAGVILGITAPIIPKAVVLGGGTGGTSIASVILRKVLPCRIPRIGAPTIGNLAARTPVLGGAIARWLPLVGYGLLAVDAYGIQDCTRQCERDNWFPHPTCSSGSCPQQ